VRYCVWFGNPFFFRGDAWILSQLNGEALFLLTRFRFCFKASVVLLPLLLSMDPDVVAMTVASLGLCSKLEQFEISPSLISPE
jgi:ABC-type maltose transport system permease subunit